jgi:membrane associated rhomboid family serine protease/Zn-finger nucleic acid-binding protein
MFACPNCGSRLIRTPHDHGGVFWACERCGGRAVGVAVLRRGLFRNYVNHVWSQVSDSQLADGKKCPSCERPMTVVHAPGPDGAHIDACKVCQWVWFDAAEYEDGAQLPKPRPRQQIPEAALELYGRSQAEKIAADWRRRYPNSELPPWEIIPGVLGLPVPEDEPLLRRIPFVTWGLAVALVIVAALAYLWPELRADWGLVPADAFRRGGLGFVTYFFLHGGMYQLLFNVYFLMVFGDDVEDYLGSGNFALLVLVGTLSGAILHAFLAPDRHAVLLGANAGVSGIVAFYGLKFPQARLRYLWGLGWYSMPASLATAFWAFSQLIGARSQLAGTDDISYLAHIGGALVGLWFWFLWRNDEPTSLGRFEVDEHRPDLGMANS